MSLDLNVDSFEESSMSVMQLPEKHDHQLSGGVSIVEGTAYVHGYLGTVTLLKVWASVCGLLAHDVSIHILLVLCEQLFFILKLN